MTLPAFATIDDLESRLPGGVVDLARAQAALDDASVEIRSTAGVSFTTDDELDFTGYAEWVQAALVKVCCSAATRSLVNPDGVTQRTIDGYSESLSNASADVYLTKAERRLVRRAAGLSTTSVPLESDTTALSAVGLEGYP